MDYFPDICGLEHLWLIAGLFSAYFENRSGIIIIIFFKPLVVKIPRVKNKR